MGYSRLGFAITLRALALLAVLSLGAYALVLTHWYAVDVLLLVAAVLIVAEMVHSMTRANREIARFLDALAFDDATQSFSALAREAPYRELGAALGRVMDRLRHGRGEREELTRYLSTLLAHVPVALIARDPAGRYTPLNPAARRLFDTSGRELGDPLRFGEAFAAGLGRLDAGGRDLLTLKRGGEHLHLKAAATAYWTRGVRQTLISLQNIADDLSAQELAAWHTLIRTISHEVMNSLTPISSLSQVARDLVVSARQDVQPGSDAAQTLEDADEALEAVARRSEGLLHFVQSHRRLTQRMSARPQTLSPARVFARLERLLKAEMAANGIAFSAVCTPAALTLRADPELLDQALINLLRNAIDAVEGRPGARIALDAARTGDLVRVSIADNGGGVAADDRDRIFVPFFTRKRQGTGVGLTLVRQIAHLHGGSVSVDDVPGGGAKFVLTLPA